MLIPDILLQDFTDDLSSLRQYSKYYSSLYSLLYKRSNLIAAHLSAATMTDTKPFKLRVKPVRPGPSEARVVGSGVSLEEEPDGQVNNSIYWLRSSLNAQTDIPSFKFPVKRKNTSCILSQAIMKFMPTAGNFVSFSFL